MNSQTDINSTSSRQPTELNSSFQSQINTQRSQQTEIQLPFNTIQLEDGTFKSKAYNIQVKEQQKLDCSDQKIITARYDPDDKFIAAGGEDSLIRIFNKDSSLNEILKHPSSKAPVSCLRWRPYTDDKTKYVLIASYMNGDIIYWHVTSQKILSQVHEGNNETLALDINKDGTKFATGGRDKIVRVYDDVKKSQFVELDSGKVPGHSNRIYCLKFTDDNTNILLSGGWDLTIKVWDLRTNRSVGYMYGPFIGGECLDYKDNKVLAGNFSEKDQIQIFDIRTYKLQMKTDWDSQSSKDGTMIQALRFVPGSNQYIFGGSCGFRKEFQIFNLNNNLESALTTNNINLSSIFSIDINTNQNEFILAGKHGLLQKFSLVL